MCCDTGNGRYTGYVDGIERFSSPDDNSDWDTRAHSFSIGSNSDSSLSSLPFDAKITTTDRDDEWLVAHNTRRQQWHQRYGKSYVPLTWSNALKTQSREYAETLLAASCGDLIHGEIYNTLPRRRPLSCVLFLIRVKTAMDTTFEQTPRVNMEKILLLIQEQGVLQQCDPLIQLSLVGSTTKRVSHTLAMHISRRYCGEVANTWDVTRRLNQGTAVECVTFKFAVMHVRVRLGPQCIQPTTLGRYFILTSFVSYFIPFI